MDTNVQTVVPGEASESDDDDVDARVTKNTTDPDQVATVVSGEASESEEDETDVPTDKQDNPELPPLKVDTNGKGDNDDITSGDRVLAPSSPTNRTADLYRPKYDTLLHRKLRERNNALRRHMVDAVHQAYQTSTKDLHNTAQQLHKSQSVVMDISHNMRLLTNDLFYLEDKIDIITTCKILPDINIAVPGTETPGPST